MVRGTNLVKLYPTVNNKHDPFGLPAYEMRSS